MVDESLKAHLTRALRGKGFPMTEADAKAGLDLLFAYTEKEHAFRRGSRLPSSPPSTRCKILDPACGSGAFPMGVLHKLVYILGKLDPDNERWKQTQLAKLDSAPMREELERAFADNNDDYGRKLYLIENCLYGVDIQPIAIQITKLRFFISLVCDQKTNRNKKPKTTASARCPIWKPSSSPRIPSSACRRWIVRLNNTGINSEPLLLRQCEWYKPENKFQFFTPDNNLNGLFHKIETHRQLEHYFPNKLIRTGESVGVKEKGFVTDELIPGAGVPCYEYLEGGKSVSERYSRPTPTRYFRFDVALLNHRNAAYRIDAIQNNRKNPKVLGIGDKMAFDNPKLLIRQSCDHLCCTYTAKPYVFNRSYYSVSNANSSGESDTSLFYILALLNSKLFTFYARKKRIIRMEHGKQPQIRLEDLKTLPVKVPALEEQTPLIERARGILAAKEANPAADTSALEREIDQQVYALYGLTPEEIAIVEGRT
jgi:hypothetical protein